MTSQRSLLLIASGILVAVFAGILFWYRVAPPQTPKRVYHIGILARGASSSYKASIESFLKKMNELGYREGETAHFDVRFIEAREDLPKIVQEFLERGVDLIHTYSTPATQEAYKATKDLSRPVSVVFGSMGDPIVAGVVKDINNPGTNVTGVASLSTELTAKRLELLKRINPAIKRVAMPHSASELKDVASEISVSIAKATAKDLGMELVFYPVKSSAENEVVAKRIIRKDVDGMIAAADSLIFAGLSRYVAQSLKEKIPYAVFDISQVQAGGLVGFGPDYIVSGEQSAVIVHQVLQGRDPAKIPVEVPRKLMLMINLKTAREIGIEVPQDLLAEADLVIE